MKRISIVVLAGLILVFSVSSAQALSVAADIPLSYSFDEGGSADSVSGMKIAISLPLIIGFGWETYTATVDADTASNIPEFNADFAILDIFFDLPLPIINIGAGVGFGTVSAEQGTFNYENGTVTQYFLTLGYPILPLIDVHLGYHVVSASVKEKTTGTEIPLDGTMMSLGVKVGF